MIIEEVLDIDDSRLSPFAKLTDVQLRNRLNPTEALIIVESPKVIKVALEQGYIPVSVLCEKKHIEGDAREILNMMPDDTPLFTADRSVLATLTGYALTRGVLCAMRRPILPSISDTLRNARRICILDGVCDTTNIGGIFRSAAALGMDAILLTPTACDPFNRRSIRVSMGSVFLIPWTRIESIEEVRKFGFKTLSMALRNNSIDISDPKLKEEELLAIIMGTEGEGLDAEIISSTDYVVKIPMYHHVDSLNVGAASAIAYWELSK